MRRIGIRSTFQLQLFGPFHLATQKGDDVTPRSRKACGLLAMLAFSPRQVRSRKWLQDHLWSDRGEAQGAASLRQCLAELRKSLPDGPPLLTIERGVVALAADAIDLRTALSNPHRLDLLEGIDIRDHEFENWLRETRASLESVAPEQDTLARSDTAAQITTPLIEAKKPTVYLRSNAGQGISLVLAEGLTGLLGQSIHEGLDVQVVSSADRPSALAEVGKDLGLTMAASVSDQGRLMHLSVSTVATGAQIWSQLIRQDSKAPTDGMTAEVLRGINMTTAKTLNWIVKQQAEGNPELRAFSKALRLSTQFDFDAFLEADRLFTEAYLINPRGLYLAWRAYLRSFMIAEMAPVDHEVVAEETREFVALALEDEPSNSLVLSLCAQCESMVFLSFVSAYELARSSVEVNPSNAFGWASLGVAVSHLGRPYEGMDHCRKARAIAGTSFFRHHIDLLSCIVAVMSGNFKEARHFGEAAHGRLPHLVAPLRFLTALCFHDRDEEAAAAAVSKLQQREPGFQVSHLRDTSYPSESLRKSALIGSLPEVTI